MRRLRVLLVGIVLLGAMGSSEAAEVRQTREEAEAPMWWLGFQLHATTDGANPGLDPNTESAYDSTHSMHFGWGGGFTVPLGVNLFHGLGMRLALSANYSGDPPFDKADAQISFLDKQVNEQGGSAEAAWGAPRQYATREAFFAGGSLLFDVQYMFPLLLGTFKPYLGAGPGLYVNYVFTDITAEDYELLDNPYNDPDDDNNIDPYSVNFAPGFNGYFGVNFKVAGSMHLNFEVQYDLARMPEAPLLKATDEADARRSAYTYSVIKLSSGLLFNF
jgi:hypothetical protein